MKVDQIICGDALEEMAKFPDNCVDLTVTSPPYDNLRKYHGYTFDFEGIAKELFRITKPGGVVVWVVGDATIDGSETGTSFRQALGFMDMGFKLADTMIYHKVAGATGSNNLYWQSFEYMFILSKGLLETHNLIEDRKNAKRPGIVTWAAGHRRDTGDKKAPRAQERREFGKRNNIWAINAANGTDREIDHPAQFPEDLARDHILSWSNPGDLILDPMCGSGTTCKMAKYHDRRFIGIEISSEYCDIARKRISALPTKLDKWMV